MTVHPVIFVLGPICDCVSGYTLTRQATEHLRSFTLVLHEGRPQILRSILFPRVA